MSATYADPSPSNRRNTVRKFRVYLLPFLLTLLLALLAHLFVVTQVSVSPRTVCHPLQAGDRVLVVRTPFATPQRGDLIAFTHPQTDEVCLAAVEALAGDSLWHDSARLEVSTYRSHPREEGLVLPGIHEPVDVDTTNLSLLHYILESEKTMADTTETLAMGRRIHVSDDYFWTEVYGPVARRDIIGVCVATSFSRQDGRMQWNRCFASIATLKRLAALQ